MSAEPNRSSQPQRGKRLEALQILRFIAAFAVVVFHYTQTLELALGMDVIVLTVGASGVDIFFVLSGFIIAYTNHGRARSPQRFLLDRIARVVPLYWALTIAIFAVSSIRPELLNSTVASIPALAKSLFFIPFERENGLIQPLLFLGWTLNYEMFFYAIFALGLLLRVQVERFAIGAIAVCYLIGKLVAFEGAVLRFFTGPLLLEFLMGVVLCVWYRNRPETFRRYRFVSLFGFALLVLQQFVEVPLTREFAWGIPAALIVFGFLGLADKAEAWQRPFLALGDASYSMYLVHPFVFQLIAVVLLRLPIPHAARVGLYTVLGFSTIMILSVLSYRIFETPARRAVRRWFGAA